MAGQVRLGGGGARAEKPGQMVAEDVEVSVERGQEYVSRGGRKLANALDSLGLDVEGRRALDAGASTGGFTDCLLKRGAEHVVAVDVAYGELHWRLREDPRVTVVERVNARSLDCEALPYRPDLVVADLSFISLRKVLPAVLRCAAPDFDCVALVKPQFELERGQVGKGGVVRDPAARRAALVAVGGRGPGARVRRAGLRAIRAAGALREPRDLRRGSRPARVAAPSPTSRPRRRRSSREQARCRHAADPPVPRADGRRGAPGDRRCLRGRDPGAPARRGGAQARPRASATAACSAPTPTARPTSASCSAATARSSRRCGCSPGVARPCSRSTTARSASSRRSTTASSRTASSARCAAITSCCDMPALGIQIDGERRIGVNDISFHRRPHSRVAELEYLVQGEQLGHVRCDGLVVSTPVGSTGYNLANGGPVLAWGVEGYVVSFIAPHTLTARALVVAPGDTLTVLNTSERDDVEVTTDGRTVGGPAAAPAPRRHVHGQRGAARAGAGRDLLPPLPGQVRPARLLGHRGTRVRFFRPGPRWQPPSHDPRAASREPAADRARRAAARTRAERHHGRDRGRQDRARARPRPAARRQAAAGHRAPGRAGGVRRGGLRDPARPARRRRVRRTARAAARGRGGDRARPARRRGGPDARLRPGPLRHRGRSARCSAGGCCRSTASTSTAS